MTITKFIKTSQNKAGFTLVEVLVVTIIIGLLAGVAVIKVGHTKEVAVVNMKKTAVIDLNKLMQASYSRGNVIPDEDVETYSDGTYTAQGANVSAFIGDLYTVIGNNGAEIPLTLESTLSLQQTTADITPGTGKVIFKGTTHRDLQAIYSADNN